MKTWRQCDVPCTVHKQISSSSTFKSETSSRDMLKKTGVEMKHPERRQEPVANETKSEQYSKKNFFIGNDLLSQVIQCFLKANNHCAYLVFPKIYIPWGVITTQKHKATENSKDLNSVKHCRPTPTDTTDRSYLTLRCFLKRTSWEATT